MQFGFHGSFIGRVDSREVLDLARSRFFVQTLWISLFANLDRCIDKHFDKVNG